MAQAKDAFQSTELSPDQRMQVDRLFDLLVNLNIIAPSPASLSSVLPTVIEEPAAIEPPLSSHTIPVEFDREELSVVGVEQLSLDFDRLPDDSKITELKTSHLDQGDQSPELLNLLIPWVAELLDRTVSESQAEVIQAFSPIVDRLLEDRISKNQASIGFALAPVISPAISKQILIDSNQVSTAIAPVIGDALKKQIEIEQDSVIDALYPVIGGTISKYLAETIRAINQQIENSVSVDGIKRKIRAKMQGVSEAELILREAIPFTVQAIFLIQKSSGLIVADIQCTDSKRLESDMIAGMLTAIRSLPTTVSWCKPT
ncbi:MAG: hypothetical protein HC780_13760 [Leptolyngbyaceae cyanobacterium CSU_1_3]|nr:hypothetical protein [Leptolyngbyaceae cyanobacterium CSU_1_3]